MPQDITVTLLDGSVLVLDGQPGAGPRLRDELEIWALVPSSAETEISRADPAIWIDALLAGQLTQAAFRGIAPDSTAWKVFPRRRGI